MPAPRRKAALRNLLRQCCRMATDPTLEEKFQGCLVGGLLGDCLGAPFETDLAGSNVPDQKTFFQNLLKHAVVARSQAKLTHSNKTGYNAAIMQCMAIAIALKSNPKTPLDPVAFVDYLIAFMDKLEEATDGFKPLCFKLMLIKKIVSDPAQDPTPAEVARMLGNDITAQGSVPTAIYSFLRSQRPLADFEHESPYVRCLYFAIACGGDSDTIAAMAGNISGARHGISVIPGVLQRQCQGVDEMARLAESIEEAVSK
ncbi:ADP-ribose glycohydrolase ARH3 isoform X1 [Ixodes scapularis]